MFRTRPIKVTTQTGVPLCRSVKTVDSPHGSDVISELVPLNDTNFPLLPDSDVFSNRTVIEAGVNLQPVQSEVLVNQSSAIASAEAFVNNVVNAKEN